MPDDASLDTAAVSSPAAPQAAAQAPARPDPTRRILEEPVGRTLLRLGIPNVGEAVARMLFITCDAIFVGWLGTDALAGLGLVLPLFFLMQMTSAGGMGVGVAAAIARALGGGKRAEANALVQHAVIVALGQAAFFAAIAFLGGRWIYTVLGGQDGALEAALAYSTVIFAGAPLVCLANLLANAFRGTGRMRLPAFTIVASEVFHLTLSPLFVLGWGPLPSLGMEGAALAALAPYTFCCVVFLIALRHKDEPLRLRFQPGRLSRALFGAILKIGTMASLTTLQIQALTFVLTGLIGSYGTAALAGYAAAVRLEMLTIPLVFAFGSALVAMVGTHVGAKRMERAKRIAWTGAGFGAIIGALTMVVSLALPQAWMSLFTADPAVVDLGARYLQWVGLAYPLFGAGLALYFAAQGADRIWWVFGGMSLRLVFTACAGLAAVSLFGASLETLLAVVAIGFVISSLAIAAAVRLEAWR